MDLRKHLEKISTKWTNNQTGWTFHQARLQTQLQTRATLATTIHWHPTRVSYSRYCAPRGLFPPWVPGAGPKVPKGPNLPKRTSTDGQIRDLIARGWSVTGSTYFVMHRMHKGPMPTPRTLWTSHYTSSSFWGYAWALFRGRMHQEPDNNCIPECTA